MFEFRESIWLIVATLVGALILWCKETPGQLRAYWLADILEQVPIRNQTARYFIQLAIFVLVGTFVALVLTNPSNVRQAFAAGLGWTAGLSTTKKSTKPSTTPRRGG